MPVTGKDLSEAEKEDLKEMCGIDGIKAGKLLAAIEDKLEAEFDDKLNRNGGGGNRRDNDNTNDRFTLNFIGANAQSINIKHIEKTMKIREVKALYLTEYGDETSAHKYASFFDKYASSKWGVKEKEKISFKYNAKPMANDKTLQYYDCTDGLLPICVVFRVKGGAENANESPVYKRGDDVLYKLIDKKSNGSECSVNWINAKVSTVFDNGNIQIEYEMPGTGKSRFPLLAKDQITDVLQPSAPQSDQSDQTKNDTEMSENKNDKQNDTENKKDKQLSDKIELKENDKIKLLLDSNEWVDGKILTIHDNTIKVSAIDNKFEIDHIDIDKKGWQKRIKLIKIKSEPLSWNEKLMSEWSKGDVECWVNSVPAFKKYAKEFGEIMDGKELLDTTNDDLTFIISSNLARRKFMEKLQSAKQKYHKLHSTAVNEEKSSTPTPTSKGVIGLDTMGNTCFLNTSIQLLCQSPYLSRYLKKRAKSHNFVSAKNAGFANWRTMKKCVTSRSTDAWNKQSKIRKRPMLNAWTDLCDIIYNQPAKNCKSTHRPSDIRDALNNIDSDFGSGEQDDSVRSLTIMLQALDSEIEEEIKQNKLGNNGKSIKAIEYMDKYQLYHGNTLSVSDENKIVAKLVSKHNPNNSIVRKIFDGIERLIYECLHCNKIFQQYVMFRDIDLPVSCNDVSFSNVNIVFNNTCDILPTCTLVDYCSIDVLKYQIIQYLQTKNKNKIDIRDIDVVTMSNTGKIKQFDNKNKLSSLQQSNDNIFVLVNNNHSNSQCATPPARLLQFKLFIDKNGQQSELAQCKYIKYGQNDVCKLIKQEIVQKNNNTGKCIVHLLHYNGKLFDPKVKIYNENIYHLNQDINVLFLLCINGGNNTLNFDITNIDALLCKQAKEKRHSRNMLDALNTLKQSKQKQTFIDDGLPQLQDTFKEAANSELIRLNRTINEFEKKEKINNFIKTWIQTTFHSKASKSKPLTDINQCLAEYQKTMIMDNNVFSYKCVHCNRDCKWTKIRKTIMYTPPILTLHLDRFGKNRKQTYHSYAFAVGDKVSCKWMGKDAYRGTFYSATISYVGPKGVRVRFDSEGKEQYIENDSSHNLYGSNKFNHCIQYQSTLNINKGKEVYDLYAISNHSGTTKSGHYTATVKSLSDNKWYNISDSNVNYGRVSPLKNQKSATILMYSREQQ